MTMNQEDESTYKLTNKPIAIKGYNGNPLILPAKTKVYKDSKGRYTSTVFKDDIPFKKEDLADPE